MMLKNRLLLLVTILACLAFLLGLLASCSSSSTSNQSPSPTPTITQAPTPTPTPTPVPTPTPSPTPTPIPTLQPTPSPTPTPIPTLQPTPSPTITVHTTWNAKWFTMEKDNPAGVYGTYIGSSQFPATFYYKWGTGPIFGGLSDWVGFQATATINMGRPGGGYVNFTVIHDEGIQLYLDGGIIINNWVLVRDNNGFPQHDSDTVSIYLTPGKHTLLLDYWEATIWAYVSFSCDSDVLKW